MTKVRRAAEGADTVTAMQVTVTALKAVITRGDSG